MLHPELILHAYVRLHAHVSCRAGGPSPNCPLPNCGDALQSMDWGAMHLRILKFAALVVSVLLLGDGSLSSARAQQDPSWRGG
jgi:hypothetical protein